MTRREALASFVMNCPPAMLDMLWSVSGLSRLYREAGE